MEFINSTFGTVLWPIKWLVEALLVGAHSLLTAIGMNPAHGITWILSIVVMTIVIRACLIPIFVRQIKNQRRMLEVAPQLKKIQEKYKGKRDQFSREAMSRETMELYKKTGTNPLSSCLPLLIQMPIFFSLTLVLENAQKGLAGVGLLNLQLAKQFGHSALFNGQAPLAQSFSGALSHHPQQGWVMLTAGIMVLLMTGSQFLTQLQIVSKNMSPETKASPQFKQQRMLLYFLPFIFLFSGYAFPLGVMFYWLSSNLWTMGQQFIVIRNMPTPGSEAAKSREARLARKGKLATDKEAVVADVQREEEARKTQRVQPVSKARAKKQSQSGTNRKPNERPAAN